MLCIVLALLCTAIVFADADQPAHALVAKGGHLLRAAAEAPSLNSVRKELHGNHAVIVESGGDDDDDDVAATDFFVGALAIFAVCALGLFFFIGYYVGAVSRSPIFKPPVPLMAGGKANAPVYTLPTTSANRFIAPEPMRVPSRTLPIVQREPLKR